MTDTKLLDGTVEDVQTGLSGLGVEALSALLTAEQAGKNRKGVIDALTEARTGAETAMDITATAGGAAVTLEDGVGAINSATISDLDRSGPADIPAATEFEPSGAPMQTTHVDLAHPAIDANPRANTTVDQNRIDFNDPSLDGRKVVERNLAAQS